MANDLFLEMKSDLKKHAEDSDRRLSDIQNHVEQLALTEMIVNAKLRHLEYANVVYKEALSLACELLEEFTGKQSEEFAADFKKQADSEMSDGR